MELGLRGVHVLVTGASGGIGLETTRVYLALGANLTAHYNTQDATLKPLLAEYPDRVQAIQANLANESQVIDLLSNAASQGNFGPVQIAVVNHGIWPQADEPVADMSLERWNNTIAANLTSSFLVIREYLRGLKNATPQQKEKAAVVMVGSTAGKFGEAGHADYAVTKSGMMYGLTMSLKNEIVKIAPKGRVNTVAPGWVGTPMAVEALKDPNVSYRALATTPLKKIATPTDVANQIALLSSNLISGHVTGQVVMVEGGMEGRLLNRPEDLA
ncbi:NAD(P)-binding protein [Heliocybe sulcata]|uniref:NAD(P)-binding protein n=1 Tax=Heliocybe sulcata TaxID=5364 RepID=A0A5C3MQW2_9AGAM|nr:NAD(P)-binding protein [Heliocybe sulcata]